MSVATQKILDRKKYEADCGKQRRALSGNLLFNIWPDVFFINETANALQRTDRGFIAAA